jgi:hypothetical protein
LRARRTGVIAGLQPGMGMFWWRWRARIYFQHAEGHMSDDLDTKSDAELNELFAVEVAGFIRMDYELYDVGEYRGVGARERSDGKWIANEVPFATNTNAVLPWLYARPEYCELGKSANGAISKGWLCVIGNIGCSIADGWCGEDKPARAVVLALLRAKRTDRSPRDETERLGSAFDEIRERNRDRA